MEFLKLTASSFYVQEAVIDSDNAEVTSGNIYLYIFEMTGGGTWKLYDWDDDTFKSSSLTTKYGSLTHKAVDSYNSGIWESPAIDGSAFTAGKKYAFKVYDNTNSEVVGIHEMVWGGNYGDMIAAPGDVTDARDDIVGADGDTLESLSDQIDGTSTLAAQDVADALKLAPTAGAPAAGSVNADLDSLITNVDQKLSTTESNIRGADSDTLETLSDQIDTVQSTVSNISNVTRLSRAVPTYFSRPSAGNVAVLIEVALKDADGSMEDPDGNQLALMVYNASGTSRDAQLFQDAALTLPLDDGSGTFAAYKKLVRSATGLYKCYYALASDAMEETLTFKFGWEENATALYEYSASQVTDAKNDINAIKLQTDKLQFSIANDIKATLDSEEVDIGSVKGAGVTDINDFKATVSALALEASVGDVNTLVTALGIVCAAIQTKTDNLPANTGTELDAIDAQLLLIKAATDALYALTEATP